MIQVHKEPGVDLSVSGEWLWRDSWAGRAIVLLLASVLMHAVVGRLADGVRVVQGADGRNAVVQNGELSTLVSVALFMAAVACAARALFVTGSRHTSSIYAGSVQLLVIWWALMTILIPRTPEGLRPKDLVIVGAPLLVMAVVSDPPTLRTIHFVNGIRDLFAVSSLTYALLVPDLAQTACRDDKCGIFGTMYTGFFVQENTAPALVSMLIPLSAVSKRTRRFLLSAGATLAVALTSGSRTGLTTAIVGIATALYIRRKRQGGREFVKVSDLIGAIPLGATMASLTVLLTADPDALTGRGRVYAGIREALSGLQAWYGVPWNTVFKATDGWISADHGQAPHILVRAGIVGLVFWILAMVGLLFYQQFTLLQLLGLAILVTGSVTMLTESAFELDSRSSGFLGLLLATGLLSTAVPEHFGSPDVLPRSLRQKATTALLLLVTITLIGGTVLLSPPAFRATTTISFSPSPDRPREARDALAAAQVRADSLSRLVMSRRVLQRALDQNGVAMPIEKARAALGVSRRELATVVTVTFEGSTPEQAQRVNDSIVNETTNLAKELEQRPLGHAQVHPEALGASTTYRVSPVTENGTVIATLLTLGAALAWNRWRQRLRVEGGMALSSVGRLRSAGSRRE